MKYFFHHFVTNPLLQKKLGDLRLYLLIVLGITLIGLGGPQVMQTAAEPLPLSGLRVTLDPGHGGYDGGARAHDSGIWEKVLTLQIAQAAAKELEAQGAQVFLTRRDDVCLCEGDTATKARKRADLQKRLDIAQAVKSDVFLSIHLNEYRDRAESGPQVFYQQGGEAGKRLSGFLQESLIDGLKPPKHRAAMAGDYYVLRGALPSALVECGFLSNAAEEKLLLSPSYHQKIARAVADGLAVWQEAEKGL